MLSLKHHIISILLAAGLLIVSFNIEFIKGWFIQSTPETELLPSFNRNGHYVNFGESLQVEADIRYGLHNPDGLLILGSSELTGADPSASMPYSFIPKHFGKQVFAIGHQGNQCMSILVQMAALGYGLENANVALIVSPGWFADAYAYGTSTQSFLEFNNERTLTQMTLNNDLPQPIREYIFNYVASQYSSIVAPSAILNHIFLSAQTFQKNAAMRIFWYPLYRLNQLVLKIKSQNEVFESQNHVVDLANKNAPLVRDTNFSAMVIQWDSLIEEAFRMHALISGNNRWGIENDYYTQHVKGKKHYYRIPAPERNIEYQDYKVLIDLFCFYKAKLTIIIQPLNPYAYENLDELNVMVDSVHQYASQHQIPVLNLFDMDTTTYQKGILTDVMHLGAAGWLKIDQFLMNQYWPHE